MLKNLPDIDSLENDGIARLIIDMFHRIVVHYGLWFTEVRHQMGTEKALMRLEAPLIKVFQYN